jgi:Kef-type K+ transport system membrane component KefB
MAAEELLFDFAIVLVAAEIGGSLFRRLGCRGRSAC